MAPSSPLGIRNNNPLNIRRSSANPWEGRVKENTQEFEQFVKMSYGYRAAAKLIIKHFDGQSSVTRERDIRANTIRRLISVWAPPTENDTNEYINFVAEETGFLPDSILSLNRYEVLRPILEAMAIAENGRKYAVPTFTDIDAGLKMAGILPVRLSALEDKRLIAPIAAGSIGVTGWVGDILTSYTDHTTEIAYFFQNTSLKKVMIVVLIGLCVYMWYQWKIAREKFTISNTEDVSI